MDPITALCFLVVALVAAIGLIWLRKMSKRDAEWRETEPEQQAKGRGGPGPVIRE